MCASASGKASHDFNPLPPCGGRLCKEMRRKAGVDYFNPLPPCGGRPAAVLPSKDRRTISIHSLRVEGDQVESCEKEDMHISIHSLRVEGDTHASLGKLRRIISIHSLRVEGDWADDAGAGAVCNFNPLPPCGGRRKEMRRDAGVDYFNPLPPCGGRQQNCTAFRLKLSRANAILTKKNTDTLLHVRKNTFFLIFLRKSGCESLLLFLCA